MNREPLSTMPGEPTGLAPADLGASLSTAPAKVKAPALFELTQELLELHQLLEEAEGDLPPELDSRLTAALEGLDRKVDAIGYIIRSFEYKQAHHHAIGQAIAQQAEPHLERAKHYERRGKELKRYVLLQLTALKATKLVGDIHVVRRQASAPRVVLDVDPRFLPERYLQPREAKLKEVAAGLEAKDPDLVGRAHFDQGEHVRIGMA